MLPVSVFSSSEEAHVGGVPSGSSGSWAHRPRPLLQRFLCNRMKNIIFSRIPFSKGKVLFRRTSLTNFLGIEKKRETSRDLIGSRTDLSENMGDLSIGPAGDQGSGARERMEGSLLCNVTPLHSSYDPHIASKLTNFISGLE